MFIVHPGVISTELASDNTGGIVDAIKGFILCDSKVGAQTTLICAVGPTDVTGGGAALVNGGYYHNTCGLMVLSDSDAVNDQVKAKTLVAQVESICEPYLHN